MSSDYRAIRRENERRYGTGVRDYGGKLLPHRYGDRTHCIYELLQNAEDALARRVSWSGPRSVRFQIGPAELQVRHFGLPFDEADVRSICGIGESTKDSRLTEIGRFGIGFKSVYAYTERPEVHSGAEDFAIEHYVLPAAAHAPASRDADETVFVLPLRSPAHAAEIREAVRRLAPRALLFLREIEEIEWRLEDGASGLYLRETESLGGGVRRVTLVGEADGQRETERAWLVFARPVPGPSGTYVRYVEVAFQLGEGNRLRRIPERDTALVAFFPTTLATGLRFRIQGPYRTTLARDNVPAADPWNERLIGATAEVLVAALRWLRDQRLLDAEALRCLPLAADRFGKGSLFAPLRDAVVRALRSEPLLPRFGSGFVSGGAARLASPKWLRELFGPRELSGLLAETPGAGWLAEDIRSGSADELSRALQDEHGVGVKTLRLDAVLRRLDAHFLEARSDEWVRRLYEALDEHRVQPRRVARIPLVRLRDGAHVPAAADGRPAPFLPGLGEAPPGFPVVRASVAGAPRALNFLRNLGLEELDPVELVLWTVAPKYRSDRQPPDEADYARDVGALVATYRAGASPARRRLVRELRRLCFVRTVDARDGTRRFSRPGDASFATASQRALFGNLPAVRFVDDGGPPLDEEGARLLLRDCAVGSLLEPFEERPALTPEERTEIRSRASGAAPGGGLVCIEDWNLRGLDPLLAAVARMPPAERERRGELLRRELEGLPGLDDLAVRSGKYECDAREGAPVPVPVPATWMRRLTASSWAPEAKPGVRIGPPDRAAGRPRAPESSSPRLRVLPGAEGETGEPAAAAERERRLAVERQAIRLILDDEDWLRAEPDNPGFDLYRKDRGGRKALLCEVKALSGSLDERPVLLTPNEFRCASENRRKYWLYIVENVAGDDPRIIRIQDPAGAAGRFAFGPEWRERGEAPP
jgi:hypothetical protein